MKALSCFLLPFALLSQAIFTEAAIQFSEVSPASGSTFADGSVAFSATVVDTTNRVSIKFVYLDLTKDGVAVYASLPKFSNIRKTDDFVYTAQGLESGATYCYQIVATNSQKESDTTSSACFSIADAPTAAPTTSPTANPTQTATASPTSAPTVPSTAAPTTQTTPGSTTEETDAQYGLQEDCFVADSSKFSICLDLSSPSGVVEPYFSYFTSARSTWESVINANGIYYTSTSYLNTDYTATGSYPGTIDGLYIASSSSAIDGAYGVLGYAGPLYYLSFSDTGLYRPMTGQMVFDSDDLDWMDTNGILKNVIEHEMGHVLGIGTMWSANGLVDYPDSNLYFGSNVLDEWQSQGCSLVSSGAPIVEMDGGSGTAGGHFDETCFDQELMTGYVDSTMILSKLTIGSLADMGYSVDFSKAEAFDLTGSCCSRRRGLGMSKQKKRFSSRRLSQELKDKAVDFGKKELKKIHKSQKDKGGLPPSAELVRSITVYVAEDGHVVDVDVTIDEDDDIFA